MSVWLPTWSIDLVRRRDRGSCEARGDRRALLLVAREGQRQVVARCCARSRAGGVRAGMAVAQARALFDAGLVRIEAHDAARDRAALRSLAVWAERFSPLVATDEWRGEADGLLADVTGCEGVFGGESRLVRAVEEALGGLGVASRVAIAPTFGCAWGVARFGAAGIVEEGGMRAAMAPLPVASLRVSDEVVVALAEVGIERVEQVLELPRSALPSRFGGEVLGCVDRALGQGLEMIEAVRAAERPRVERVFDGPTDRTEAIERAARELLGEVSAALLARESGARSLEVELVRSDLPPERVLIVLGRPSRDARHLWSLLRPKLERAHLGFGVEAVRVRVASVGRVRHEQAERWIQPRGAGGARGDRAFAELVDTLVNRVGAERVVRVEPVESHLPERAFERRSVTREASRGVAGIEPADRPTMLLERPAPAAVVALAPDGPIHRVRWGGVERAIVACAGPWRVACEWWRVPGPERDYYAAQQDDGRWVWLCRVQGTGRWFVHGVWA